MIPQQELVRVFIEFCNPDAVFICRLLLGDYVHCHLRQIEVCADPNGSCDAGRFQHVSYHRHCHNMSRIGIQLLGFFSVCVEIAGTVYKAFINGIDMDIFRRHISQVDAVDLSGDPFVFCHPRYCDNIVDLCMAADLVLPDLLLCLEEPWPSWDALCLQRGGDRQTDRLVGSGLVRYQQVCLKRIESPMNTFYGCVI